MAEGSNRNYYSVKDEREKDDHYQYMKMNYSSSPKTTKRHLQTKANTQGLLSWKSGKGFLLPFPLREAGTVQFLFPSPLDRIRSGIGRKERATQLGLNLARNNESFEGNQSFPRINNNTNGSNRCAADAKTCTMDKFRGDELNTFSFSPGHVRGSFAKTPDSTSRTMSFNDSWTFYNLFTNGQAPTSSIPSNIYNPNKAVVTIDAKSSEILVANDMACRLFGYNSDELCQRRLADMFKHRSNQKAIVETHLNSSGEVVLVSGKVIDVVDSEGEVIPVSLWVKKLEMGMACRCLAVMEPVERTTATFSFDNEGRILSCDKTMAVLHGYSSVSEVVGLNIRTLIPSFVLPSDDARVISKNVKKQQATGRTKDGATFPVSVIVESVSSNNIFYDDIISEEFNVESPTLERNLSVFSSQLPDSFSEFLLPTAECSSAASTTEKYATYTGLVWVFANISGMITILPDGTIHSCNHYFALMLLGYTQSQLVGKNISSLVPTFYDDVEFLEAESTSLAAYDDDDLDDNDIITHSPVGTDNVVSADSDMWREQSSDFSRTNSSTWREVTESLRQLGIYRTTGKDESIARALHKLLIEKEYTNESILKTNERLASGAESETEDESRLHNARDLNGNEAERATTLDGGNTSKFTDGVLTTQLTDSAYSGSNDNVSAPNSDRSRPRSREQKSLPEVLFRLSPIGGAQSNVGRSRSFFSLTNDRTFEDESAKNSPLESSSSNTITDNPPDGTRNNTAAAAKEDLPEFCIEQTSYPSIPEGSFFGLGRHRDGSDLSIIYQIKRVNLDDGQVLYCIWVSRDPEEPAEGGRAIGNLTLASSMNSTLDASASSLSLGQIINEKAHLAESNQSAADHSDVDYVSGPFAERYATLQQIGKGAFGCVKMAFRNSDKLLVITKFIRKSKVYDECWVDDNLLKKTVPLEVSLLTTLKHPNVVQVLDVFENADYFQMVMEKHGCGMDLFEFIDRGPNLDEPLASFIFRQVASAVGYLHGLNILHRDIKDENIILNEHFHIKLIDFGSATFMAPGKLFSTFCGTVEYCSPEVLQGNKYRGPELEMWSLGVTLYTLIFGENPFFDVDETIKAVLRPPFQASKDLMHLISGLLNPDPKLRFGLRELEMNVWLYQPIDISTYHFENVISCSMDEANPPRYYYDLEIGDHPYREFKLHDETSSVDDDANVGNKKK